MGQRAAPRTAGHPERGRDTCGSEGQPPATEALVRWPPEGPAARKCSAAGAPHGPSASTKRISPSYCCSPSPDDRRRLNCVSASCSPRRAPAPAPLAHQPPPLAHPRHTRPISVALVSYRAARGLAAAAAIAWHLAITPAVAAAVTTARRRTVAARLPVSRARIASTHRRRGAPSKPDPGSRVPETSDSHPGPGRMCALRAAPRPSHSVHAITRGQTYKLYRVSCPESRLLAVAWMR